MILFRSLVTPTYILLLCLCLPAQAMPAKWIEQSQRESSYTLDLNALSNFYDDNLRYFWLKKQQKTNQAYDALDFISASSHHGLQPSDYHYSILNKLDPSLDEASAKKFDILLSDGLLKLVHDLSVGRLKANKADPDWFIPQAEFDVNAFLQQALLTKHLRTALESLIPASDKYVKLTQALARYQRYAARGGWSEISKGSSIRPGESHQQIPAIQARLSFEYGHIVLLNNPDSSLNYDLQTEQAVRYFQKTHGLKVDGIIGKSTRSAMNISASDRVQQLKVALERRRWMPDDLGEQYLFINLANYTLSAVEDGVEKLSSQPLKKNRK